MLVVIVGVMSILKHRANIVRLLHGEENKLGDKKKISEIKEED